MSESTLFAMGCSVFFIFLAGVYASMREQLAHHKDDLSIASKSPTKAASAPEPSQRSKQTTFNPSLG